MASPKPAWLWLLEKEGRALLASRAWWLMLLGMGPLVGWSFISAVHTYAEVSGLNGTAAGVGEALSPLIGVWSPTFSACELVAVFLLPFVAIGLVAGDRQSGALKLELQQKRSTLTLVWTKALILLGGWLVALLPAMSALLLWKAYGGSLYPPELRSLLLAHLLNAGLTVSLAALAAAITDSQATAAILTLGVTVGTWVMSIAGSIQGGWWEQMAAYTPAAMVSQLQHGLVRLSVVWIALIFITTGLLLAAIWIRLDWTLARKIGISTVIAGVTLVCVVAASHVSSSWDLSESRGNSFPLADEQRLKSIHGTLLMEVHLAPEDPRRQDLEARVLSKLRRLLPELQIRFVSATTIGLFEQTNAGYGEIRYQWAGHKTVSRATTAEGALEAIYDVAGIKPPADEEEEVFRGHPLQVVPHGAALLFYGIWPAVFACGAILMRWRLR